jgi:hypothetical protein
VLINVFTADPANQRRLIEIPTKATDVSVVMSMASPNGLTLHCHSILGCLNLAAAGTAWSAKCYMNMRPLYQPQVTQTEAVAQGPRRGQATPPIDSKQVASASRQINVSLLRTPFLRPAFLDAACPS